MISYCSNLCWCSFFVRWSFLTLSYFSMTLGYILAFCHQSHLLMNWQTLLVAKSFATLVEMSTPSPSTKEFRDRFVMINYFSTTPVSLLEFQQSHFGRYLLLDFSHAFYFLNMKHLFSEESCPCESRLFSSLLILFASLETDQFKGDLDLKQTFLCHPLFLQNFSHLMQSLMYLSFGLVCCIIFQNRFIQAYKVTDFLLNCSKSNLIDSLFLNCLDWKLLECFGGDYCYMLISLSFDVILQMFILLMVVL